MDRRPPPALLSRPATAEEGALWPPRPHVEEPLEAACREEPPARLQGGRDLARAGPPAPDRPDDRPHRLPAAPVQAPALRPQLWDRRGRRGLRHAVGPVPHQQSPGEPALARPEPALGRHLRGGDDPPRLAQQPAEGPLARHLRLRGRADDAHLSSSASALRMIWLPPCSATV